MKQQAFDPTVARQIAEQHDNRPERLVQILVAIVRRFGYVHEDVTPLLADQLNLSRADVHGVISYYHDFRTEQPGRHILKICQAEACRAVGAKELANHARRLGTGAGGETDGLLTVEPVYCLGNCALGPAAMLDGRPLGRVDTAKLEGLLASLGETGS